MTSSLQHASTNSLGNRNFGDILFHSLLPISLIIWKGFQNVGLYYTTVFFDAGPIAFQNPFLANRVISALARGTKYREAVFPLSSPTSFSK